MKISWENFLLVKTLFSFLLEAFKNPMGKKNKNKNPMGYLLPLRHCLLKAIACITFFYFLVRSRRG